MFEHVVPNIKTTVHAGGKEHCGPDRGPTTVCEIGFVEPEGEGMAIYILILLRMNYKCELDVCEFLIYIKVNSLFIP